MPTPSQAHPQGSHHAHFAAEAAKSGSCLQLTELNEQNRKASQDLQFLGCRTAGQEGTVGSWDPTPGLEGGTLVPNSLLSKALACSLFISGRLVFSPHGLPPYCCVTLGLSLHLENGDNQSSSSMPSGKKDK